MGVKQALRSLDAFPRAEDHLMQKTQSGAFGIYTHFALEITSIFLGNWVIMIDNEWYYVDFLTFALMLPVYCSGVWSNVNACNFSTKHYEWNYWIRKLVAEYSSVVINRITWTFLVSSPKSFVVSFWAFLVRFCISQMALDAYQQWCSCDSGV